MKISSPNIIFFSIILITGGLTIFTDLKNKKIHNQHLAIGAILGLAALIYTAIWAHENTLFHIINGLIAFAIGYCFYHFSLWKGGDAKLFTLFAFLMPALEHVPFLISSAINLFACSFIAGTIILFPFFIKDIVLNYNAVFRVLFTRELLASVRITILYSWLSFPVYYFAKIIHIPAASLLVTYLIFNISHHFFRKMDMDHTTLYILRIAVVLFGFLMRLWLDPQALSWPVLPYSILKIVLFTLLFACIYSLLDLFKKYNDRIPFAPLLFTGCLLSYTPFLTWIMHLVAR